MQNISFEEGYKEFQINNDPNRVLRFNPRDMNLMPKIENAKKEIDEFTKTIKDKDDVEAIKLANTKLKEIVDDIFYEGSFEIIFGEQSPLTLIGGKTIFERFFEAVGNVIKPYVEKEKELSNKRLKKYKDVYDRIPSENAKG